MVRIITRALCLVAGLLWGLSAAQPAPAQVQFTGRILTPPAPGADATLPITNIPGFANLDGPGNQALTARTKYDVLPWDIDPKGGYRMSGSAGNYTFLFSNPSHFMRPILQTNLHVEDGAVVERDLHPVFDYALFTEAEKDSEPAAAYFQTFVAAGTSLTSVGFKPIWEPQGESDEAKALWVSIHRAGDGSPEDWATVGPERMVPFQTLHNLPVDGAGARGFPYSAGWNSGEVPLIPGETYAVRIRVAEAPTTFRMFVGDDDEPRTRGYRIDAGGAGGWLDADLWMAVGADRDGLVIAYNKGVFREFVRGTHFAPKWSQTYVARGRGLAGVVLYAGGATEQIPLRRQRAVVRVRQGGPGGPVVGIEKIARGDGDWTGDASWGVLGVAFAPGEVDLVPGETYAIEFETFENVETLRGYVNIKNVPSGDVGGFSPHRKAEPDSYPLGTAYRNGTEPMDYDLDMQIIEYAETDPDWSRALVHGNLLVNGDMQAGAMRADDPEGSRADGWTPFALDPQTTFHYVPDKAHPENRILRVIGGCYNDKTVDGGYVQRVSGLSNAETYRLAGKLRSSFAVDLAHQSFIGVDPTGQVESATAASIHWMTLPPVHGVFVDAMSEPVRPRDGAISVWLRARTTSTACSGITVVGDPYVFTTDFDDFALRQVNTGAPGL